MTNQSRKTNLGFTLIELLVVISIIGFMSGLFLVAYQGAAQESNVQKTRTTVQKISEVLNARMEEYSSFPIALQNVNPSLPIGPIPGKAFASGVPAEFENATVLLERARLLSLREIIAMEMPDHPDDLRWSAKWSATANRSSPIYWDRLTKPLPTGLYVQVNSAGASEPVFVKNKPTARIRGLVGRLSSGNVPITGWEDTNANAELLFLIIEDSDLSGSSAIELFGKSEIGDTDGDGLKEFVDAFGRPIQWIRWPTGYEGVARFHPDMLGPDILVGPSSDIRVSISSDPLDRIGADPGLSRHLNSAATATREALKPGPGAFPLVMSAGRDKSFGILFELKSSDGIAVGSITSYSVKDARWPIAQPNYPLAAGVYPFTDPWYPRRVSPTPERLGSRLTPTDLTSSDNISNYDGNGAAL